MRALLLAPHNDDEALFASFTLMRERPLVVVVTDSWVQWNRGDGITAQERWRESEAACAALGCLCMRLGIRDDTLDQPHVAELLRHAYPPEHWDRVYVPALQGGHVHHDIVHLAARQVYGDRKLVCYCTYSDTKRYYANEGAVMVNGTPYEHERKRHALAFYKSQHARSARHFVAVDNQPEWLTYLWTGGVEEDVQP